MFSIFNKPDPTPQITLLPPEEMGRGAKRDQIIKIITAVALSALALGLTVCTYTYLASFTYSSTEAWGFIVLSPTAFASMLIPTPFLPFDLKDYSSKANVQKYFEQMKIGHNFAPKELSLQKLVKYKYITADTKDLIQSTHKDFRNNFFEIHRKANFLRVNFPLLEDREVAKVKTEIQNLKVEQERLNASWNSLRSKLIENMNS